MTARLMICLALAWPVAGGADCPGAGRLEEALRLVDAAHPALRAEQHAYQEQQRQPPWEASLSVGYSITETLESGAAGPNAALRVQIPLWDRTSRIQAAKERAALVAKEDALRAAVLAEVEALCEQAHAVRALDAAQQFARDQLAYRQERVDQGLDPAEALWAQADAYQTAKHSWEQATAELATRCLTLARRYGGAEWPRLQVLFEAMTR